MKKRQISWEIILCGLIFTGLAIYISNSGTYSTNKSGISESTDISAPDTPTPPQEPTPPDPPAKLNLEGELSKLEEKLKNLENLDQLKNLKALESLNVNSENLGKMMQQLMDEVNTELGKLNSKNFDANDKTQLLALVNSHMARTGLHQDKQKWIHAGDGVYQYNISFLAGNADEMSLDLDAGHINISSHEADSGLVQFVSSGEEVSSNKMDEIFTITKVLKDNSVAIKLEKKDSFFDNNTAKIEAHILVPAGTSVKAETAGGHVRVDDLEGNHSLHTNGGHITLRNVSGEIHTKTNGGHIEGSNLKGDFQLITDGGHIEVENLNGKCRANTKGGHITFKQLQGSAQAKTSGGNISVSVKSLSDDLELQTSAGNISITLPESISAYLDLKGTSVDLNSFKSRVDGTIRKNYVDGILGDGGPKIKAHCSYGRVTVE